MDSKALLYSVIISLVMFALGGFYIFSATNLNSLSSQITSKRQSLQPVPSVDFSQINKLGIFDREEFFDLPINILELSLGKEDPFAN